MRRYVGSYNFLRKEENVLRKGGGQELNRSGSDDANGILGQEQQASALQLLRRDTTQPGMLNT